MLSQKNCINCAFLTLKEEKFISGHFVTNPRWIEKIKSLNAEQRNSIKKEVFDFLGESLKKNNEWSEEYYKKKQQRDKNQMFQMRSLSLYGSGVTEEELDELGMEEPPKFNDHESLECYHQQWSEGSNRKNKIDKNFLEEKSCPFFFAHEKMKRQTLKGCEKMRLHENNKNRFIITNILVLLGIIITIASYPSLQKNIINKYSKVEFYIKDKIENYKKKND